MATLIAYQSGNYTGATTFKQIATGTGSSQTAFSAQTTTTTSYVYSPAFTVTDTQVIEGVLLHLRQASATGTFSVALSDDDGVTATREVTIDTADISTSTGTTIGTWVFLKFASTLTADGGNDYKIGVKSSTNASVNVFRSATAADWSRLLRRSDTATIASTDAVYICDELTGSGTKTDIEVTMDSTSSATTYGAIEIGQGGVLSYGTSGSTNYHLKLAGNMLVRGGGTLNIGTTGTPIPRTSTAKLEFASASAAQYGVEILDAGTFNAQGLSRTADKDIYYALLNTDEAIGQTVLGVDTDTGWLSGDRIGLASTGASRTEDETRTLSANATSTELTVSSGLTFAHLGTDPTQAEIVLLTRNVEIYGASQTNTTYLLFASTATVDIDWVYFKWLGANITNKLGITALTTTGSCNIQYSAIEDTSTAANVSGFVALNSTANITFSNNVIVNVGQRAIFLGSFGTGAIEVNNNVVIRTALHGLELNRLTNVVCNGNRVSGVASTAFRFFVEFETIASFDGNVAHNNENGIVFRCKATITNVKSWHNIGTGFASLEGRKNFSNCDFYGNGLYNLTIERESDTEINDCTFSGTTTRGSANGLLYVSNTGGRVTLNSCVFRTTSGIYTAHTTGDVVMFHPNGNSSVDTFLNNCVMGATTEVANQQGLANNFYIGSTKHDQTAGLHRAWKKFGSITTDSTIFNAAAPSERLTPNDATNKLESGTKLVAIANATTKTVSVYVRKSVTGDGTDYNGNQPRLRYKRADAAGLTSDATLDTMAVANGTWELLTATTPTITDDAVLEFYVDCDGTAGWINVDDWTIS